MREGENRRQKAFNCGINQSIDDSGFSINQKRASFGESFTELKCDVQEQSTEPHLFLILGGEKRNAIQELSCPQRRWTTIVLPGLGESGARRAEMGEPHATTCDPRLDLPAQSWVQ